jgi:hypothetical protein
MDTSCTSRRCLRDPIPEILEAACLLDEAVSAHLGGDTGRVGLLVKRANMPAIREWTESLWGRNSPYAPSRKRLHGKLEPASGGSRRPARMPNAEIQRRLHERDGYHCRFCGIPVIRKAVRQRFCKLYPQLQVWGRKNIEQHAAFQAMWVQYDHLVPHSHGGANDLENIVVTCAPCNFGRMDFTLIEANLIDPRFRDPVRSSWDGLERMR